MTEMVYDDFMSPLERDILEVLKEYKQADRSTLVKILKRPRTTIYDNAMKLVKRNLIRKVERSENMRGRPRVYFVLNEDN